MTQKYQVSKCCWKNGTDRFVWCCVAPNLQFVKNAVSAKCNRRRYVCLSFAQNTSMALHLIFRMKTNALPVAHQALVILTFHSSSNIVSKHFPWVTSLHPHSLPTVTWICHDTPRFSLCNDSPSHAWDAYPAGSHMISSLTSFKCVLKVSFSVRPFFTTLTLSPNSPCPLAVFIFFTFNVLGVDLTCLV